MLYNIILAASLLCYNYAILWNFFGPPHTKNLRVAGGLVAAILLGLIDIFCMHMGWL